MTQFGWCNDARDWADEAMLSPNDGRLKYGPRIEKGVVFCVAGPFEDAWEGGLSDYSFQEKSKVERRDM